MKRIDFLICGAQKAGTSALDKYMRKHPSIQMPTSKEIHYFDRETINWEEEQGNDYKLYHQSFNWNEQKTRGETTPVYMYWKTSWARINKYHKELKIIILLRNPITRAFSHWNMERERGRENLGFMEAITSEGHRLGNHEEQTINHRKWSYVQRGFYSTQIQHIYNYINKKNVLILKQEELLESHTNALGKIYQHLNLKEIANNKEIIDHKSSYGESISKEAKIWLKNKYEDEIKKLECLLNWDCSSWLSVE